MKRHIVVIGFNLLDAKHEASYLAKAGDVTPVSVLSTTAARGLVIDAIFVSPSAVGHYRINDALDELRPGLATRRRPRKGR